MKILLLCLVSLISNSIFAQRIIEGNDRLEIIGHNEKATATAEYESIEWNGSFGMTLKDGKQGMINRTRKVIIPNEYESIEWNGSIGRTLKDGEIGYINLDGERPSDSTLKTLRLEDPIGASPTSKPTRREE